MFLMSYLQIIIFLCCHKYNILDRAQKEKTGYCSYLSNPRKVSAKKAKASVMSLTA